MSTEIKIAEYIVPIMAATGWTSEKMSSLGQCRDMSLYLAILERMNRIILATSDISLYESIFKLAQQAVYEGARDGDNFNKFFSFEATYD